MLIAIEGIDGSGKGTQTALLSKRARGAGLHVETFSFPQYGTNPFAACVAQYLNGVFGPALSVPAHFSALLYAGDRFCAREQLLAAAGASDLVICDRYTDSNLAHQAAKLPPHDRASFIAWIESIEYGSYRLPRPDLTVLLDMPLPLARELVRLKASRTYTSRTADIHEADAGYLEACAEVYSYLAGRPGAPWVVIGCAIDGQVRSEESIAEELWGAISPRLP